MDTAAFQTSIAKPGASLQGGAGKTALAGTGTGVMSLSGGSFFDLMFARLATTPKETAAGSKNGETALQSGSPALGKLQNVKITELPDGTLGVTIEGKTLDLSPEMLNEALMTTGQATNLLDNVADKKKFLEFLGSLLAGLPEGETPAIDVTGKLTKKDLMGSVSGGEFPALVATGLSPEKLSEAMEKFARDILEQYDGDEGVQGVIVGLVKMMPPKADGPFDAIVLPKALFVSKSGNSMTGQAAAAPLPSTAAQAPAGPPSLEAAMNALLGPRASVNDGTGGRIGGVIAGADGAEASTGQSNARGGAANNNNPAMFISFLSGLEFPFAGELFAPRGWSDTVADQMNLHPLGQNLTSTGSMTQVVTHAQHASAAHPATQVVAAHMQKVGTTQDSRNLTLQLDPPDLGRVEVRMQFSAKDKSVKAHMLIEKPETYFMLQRDAQVLERALQNAGLDVSGDSLNFELAQDGQDFSQNGGHDGQGPAGGGDGDGGETAELIETTMDFYIDPETGAMRYDLYV
ncbi:MAG: flagellar hook-length control protein FliK [Alphaproteobacteria bacterium]|nr:flagellar hook-length control protein FliK [Alphaproteobacteria bacterium]